MFPDAWRGRAIGAVQCLPMPTQVPDLAAPDCRDRVVGAGDPAGWKLGSPEALWAPPRRG